MENIQCPECESKEITKRGIRYTERREKIQKYFCKTCKHRFILDNPFFRMRNKEQFKEVTMDKDTFLASCELVKGVRDDVETYLFESRQWHEKIQILENIDEAIKELESWKKAIMEVKDG